MERNGVLVYFDLVFYMSYLLYNSKVTTITKRTFQQVPHPPCTDTQLRSPKLQLTAHILHFVS